MKGEHITYGTMDMTGKDKIEDNGVVIKPSDPNISFLPSYALKVDNITDQISKEVKDEILEEANASNGEVKVVYDVKVLEDNVAVQPDGSVEISIPVDENILHPKILMKSKEGKWKIMEGEFKDGTFIFSTDYVGEVSVVGDKAEEPSPDPIPIPKPKPPVQGSYINNGGIGGAGTGDDTNALFYLFFMGTMGCLVYCLRKKIHR